MLEKLEAEAQRKRTVAREQGDREAAAVREAAADLLRICEKPAEAGRYFVESKRSEIEENEFNLKPAAIRRYLRARGENRIADALSALETAHVRDAD